MNFKDELFYCLSITFIIMMLLANLCLINPGSEKVSILDSCGAGSWMVTMVVNPDATSSHYQ